ncbi:MAG: hypothetical protein ABIG03_03330 [Candidatus Eisenbacteria bacterium]
MGRAKLWPLVLVSVLPLLVLSGCSDREVNPFDPSQDPNPPVVANFTYSGGEAQWSTNEEALCVLEYGLVGGDYEHYVYESTKHHSTYHRVTLLEAVDGETYQVRIRSIDRAGNEDYEADGLPSSIVGRAFRDDTMTLAMIDVGWGLSMVLTTPDGSHVLIDSASDDHFTDVLDYIQGQSINWFDAAVATHYHGDHVGGYNETGGVLDVYGFGAFIGPNAATAYVPIWTGIAETIAAMGLEVTDVSQGDNSDNTPELDWDDTPGFHVEVLGAGNGGLVGGPDDSGTEGMKGNNDSVVMRFTFLGVSFVTTGDAEYFTEYGIIDAYGRAGSRADLVQIGHHGNDDATSELWLDNVSPRVAFISNAMLEAQLQKESVTQGIRAVDADYFVTDRVFPNTPRNVDPDHGNLIAVTDGQTMEIVLDRH